VLDRTLFRLSLCRSDIDDQIRKLSKIGAEFWTFVPSHFFVEDGSSKILSTLSRLPRFTSRGKIS